jgi:hypothetical protein
MITCLHCQANLNPEQINTRQLEACPSCATLQRVDVFPALIKEPLNGTAGHVLQADKEASCYYHGNKQAVVTCAACGRFVCALCDVELNGRHLCPHCFEVGKTKQKIRNLENSRTCYDAIAIHLATLPLLIFWLTIITAPVVIYICIRYWNTPGSIIARPKWRFVVALLLAIAQLIGWIFFFVQVFN